MTKSSTKLEQAIPAVRRSIRTIAITAGSRSQSVLLFLVCAAMALPGQAQALLDKPVAEPMVEEVTMARPEKMYVRPTQKTKVTNYLFDTFGPYPVVGAVVAAGIGQESNSPPEWNQGVEGYSKRFGSDLGIAAVATTTRYGLAQAFKEDTLYYQCECTGTFPRLRHAMFSTLTARRRVDGHRVFSIPALVAPYAGSMTATYAWYPYRFGAKDGFRTGSYGLLAYMGSNIALEFFHSRSRSWIHRMHLNNAHGSPVEGPNQ